MPGPTTEVLNEDVRELKGEIRDIRSDMATMRADIHAIAVGLAEFRVFMRVVTWAGALLVTTALTGGVAAVWWASGITSEVRQLGGAVAKVENRLTSVETKMTSVETRLTSVETRLTSIEAKILPTPPSPAKPAGPSTQ